MLVCDRLCGKSDGWVDGWMDSVSLRCSLIVCVVSQIDGWMDR